MIYQFHNHIKKIRIGNDRNPLSPYTPYSEDQSDSDGGEYIEKKGKFKFIRLIIL